MRPARERHAFYISCQQDNRKSSIVQSSWEPPVEDVQAYQTLCISASYRYQDSVFIIGLLFQLYRDLRPIQLNMNWVNRVAWLDGLALCNEQEWVSFRYTKRVGRESDVLYGFEPGQSDHRSFPGTPNLIRDPVPGGRREHCRLRDASVSGKHPHYVTVSIHAWYGCPGVRAKTTRPTYVPPRLRTTHLPNGLPKLMFTQP